MCMNRKQGVLILAVLLVILGFIVHHYSGWGWKDIRKQIPIGTTTGLKGVLLVNFETQSDDELPWGPYCARVLYSKLHYAPNEIMYLPYISWLLTDMGDNGIHYPKLAPLNIETEKYYAKVYNAGYILHGKIIKTTDQLQFRGYLYDCQQQSMLPEMNLTVPMNQPEDLFIQIAQQVTSQLKIKLSPETVKYLQLKNTGNATAFPIALQGFSTEPENFAAAADLYSGRFRQMVISFLPIWGIVTGCPMPIRKKPSRLSAADSTSSRKTVIYGKRNCWRWKMPTTRETLPGNAPSFARRILTT